MTLLHSLIMAFSMFSAIPMPYINWDERPMRYMMACFPAVGIVLGALQVAWWHLCTVLGFGPLLRAAGLTVLPLVVTGGIHLDGFADVVDALSSHAEPERKRQIMKDPHVGAFAIIGVCAYLIAYLGLASELQATQLLQFACVPVISRCISGLATVTLRTASKIGMLAAERASANKGPVRMALAALLLLASVLMVTRGVLPGACALAAAALVAPYVVRLAEREFGGMGGDLAGYLLQVTELVMLACLVVVGRLV